MEARRLFIFRPRRTSLAQAVTASLAIWCYTMSLPLRLHRLVVSHTGPPLLPKLKESIFRRLIAVTQKATSAPFRADIRSAEVCGFIYMSSASAPGTNPFRCGASDGSNAVPEQLKRLPSVLHPIFSRCKRTLSNEEWHRLQFLTTEQRCAALGMQMEGQHVNSIVAYLLACVEGGPKSSGPHAKGSVSQGRSVPQAVASSPPPLESARRTNGISEPRLVTHLGGQAVTPPTHSAAASKVGLHTARIVALAPPHLLRQRVDPTETHSFERLHSRGGSASRWQSTLMAPSPKLMARKLPSGIANVTMTTRRAQAPAESLAGSSPARAVSPIAPPTRAPKHIVQHTPALSPNVTLHVPLNNAVAAAATASDPVHIDEEALRRVDTGSLAGRRTPHSEDAPMPRSNTRMPRRESRGVGAPSSSSSLTPQSIALSVETKPRMPDYQRAVVVTATDSGASPPRTSPPLFEPHAYSPTNSLSRLDTSVSSGSGGTPRRRLSPERTSRWLVDFQRKLEAVGLDMTAWRGLSTEEQDEFFLYWRMPHLQVSLVRDELR